jgi:hypothetical protein
MTQGYTELQCSACCSSVALMVRAGRRRLLQVSRPCWGRVVLFGLALVLAFVVGLGVVLARIWCRQRRPRVPVLFSNVEGGKLGSGRTKGDAGGAGVGRRGIAAGGMIVGRTTGVATLRGVSGPGLGATLRGAAASGLFDGVARPVTSSASKWRVATWLLPRGARGEAGEQEAKPGMGAERAYRMS